MTNKPPLLSPNEEAGAVETYLAPAPPSKGKIYAVDQHPDINTISIVAGMTPHDMQVLETRGDLNFEQMIKWLSEQATSDDIILVEASSGSFELSKRLSMEALNCCVLESAWIGEQADKYRDSDKLASIRIARVYLQGNAKAVWVPDQKTVELRQLLHIHLKAVQAKTKATNMLKSFLTYYAIRSGNKNLTTPRVQEQVYQKRKWTEAERFHLEDLFSELEHARKRCQKIEKQMALEVAQCPTMLKLMSLLGVGRIIAFSMVACIGDIHRFKTPKKLAAYIGLNPNQKTSGKGKKIKIGVGATGRKDLRNLLIQGAQAVLRRGSQTPLGKWGMQLMLRKGNRNIAVAAIARRMAMQIWHVMMGNKPELLEPSKSRNTKFMKLLASLGKAGRETLGLPKLSKDSIEYFNQFLTKQSLTEITLD